MVNKHTCGFEHETKEKFASCYSWVELGQMPEVWLKGQPEPEEREISTKIIDNKDNNSNNK